MWDQVVREVDQDGNGEVDFDEFKTMMQKLLTDKPASSMQKVAQAQEAALGQ